MGEEYLYFLVAVQLMKSLLITSSVSVVLGVEFVHYSDIEFAYILGHGCHKCMHIFHQYFMHILTISHIVVSQAVLHYVTLDSIEFLLLLLFI